MADVEYKIKFDADASGAKKGFSELANSASKAASKITSAMNNIEKSVLSGFGTALKAPGKALMGMASSFTKVLKGVLIGGGAALVGAAYKGIEAADELNDSVELVNSAFGANAEELHTWAKESASAYGLARVNAEKYFSEIGGYLKNVGVDSGQSATIAKNLTGKAGELSRSYGVSSDKAFEALTKGVETGSKKSLMQFGVVLSDDAYQAEMLREGLEGTYNELSEADQLVVRYNTVMSQLGDVTGSTAGEFTTWEGAVAGLVSNTKDALATFGQILQAYLLPVVQLLAKIMQSVSASLSNLLGTLGVETGGSIAPIEDYSEAIEGLGDSAEEAGKKSKKASGGLASFDKINNMSQGSGGAGGATAIKKTAKAVDLLGNSAKKDVKPLKDLFDEFMNADWEAAGKKVGKGINSVIDKLRSLGEWLKTGKLGSNIGDFLNGLTDSGVWGNATRSTITLITGLLTTIGETFKTADMFAIGSQLLDGLIQGITENKGKIAEELSNILTGLSDFIIGAFDPKKMGDLGKGLGDIVNGVAKSGSISKVTEALTTMILGIVNFILEFVKTVNWLDIAVEILKGIGNAIMKNPGTVIEALGVWLAWDSVKHLFTGLGSIGSGISGGIAGGIKGALPVIEAAVAGISAIIAAGTSQIKDYIDSVMSIDNAYDAAISAETSYIGKVQEGMASALEEHGINIAYNISKQSNEINEAFQKLQESINNRGGVVDDDDIAQFDSLIKQLEAFKTTAEEAGMSSEGLNQISAAIEKYKSLDLSEGVWIFGESDITDIKNGWAEVINGVSGADKVFRDANATFEAFDKGELNASNAVENTTNKVDENKKSTEELSKAVLQLSGTDLPKFKQQLEDLNTPLDTYLEKVGKLVDLKFSGDIIDTKTMQTNLDNAVRIVEDAVKKIDKAITDSTNLKNFETTLSSTQTIKVDTSGKFGVTVDAKAHIDSSELASWYDEFTMGNKNSRG